MRTDANNPDSEPRPPGAISGAFSAPMHQHAIDANIPSPDPGCYDDPVPPTLETTRLLLHPLELADAVQIQQIFPKWEIVRYLSSAVPWPYPPDGALKFCDETIPAMNRGEAWYWTLRLRTNPEQVIGLISLTTEENNNRGFWLDPPWQRKGIMSEAVDTVTDFWFNSLGFSVLRAPKAAPNIASRRISEKHGMRIVAREERDYVAGRLPAEIWEITVEEWRRYRSRA
jgi:RimJ/RimL family protein N-acetyltransferase